MSFEIDTTTDRILQDDEFQQEQRQRESARRVESLRSEMSLEPPKHEGASVAVRLAQLARQRRAEQITRDQDIAARANPDVVKQRIDNIRNTGTPNDPVGLSPAERARRAEVLSNDDTLLDFYDLTPEARVYAADDTSYLGLAYEALKSAPKIFTEEIPEAINVISGSIRTTIANDRQADLANRLQEMNLTGFGEEDRAQVEAELAEVRAFVESLEPEEPLTRGDRTLYGAAQFVTQNLDDSFDAAVATGKVVVPSLVAATAIGALAGSVLPGVGTAAGAGTGFKVAARRIPLVWNTALSREFINRSRGLAYERLVREGFDPTDPATMAGATVEGLFVGATEKLQFNMIRGFMRPSIGAARARASKLVGMNLTRWMRKPGKAALLGRTYAGVLALGGTEAAEEFLQNSVGESLANSVASRQGEGFAGALLGVADFDEVMDGTVERLGQAAEAGLDAFLAVVLTGGLYRGATTRFIMNTEARLAAEQEVFSAYAEHAEASTMIQRSKEAGGKFFDFVLNQGRPGGEASVYVDPVAFLQTLEAQGITLDEAETVLPGLHTRLQEAQQNGTRLRIPAKDFATHVAGSNVMEGIRDHISTSEDGPTLAERQAHFEAQEAAERDALTERDRVVQERLSMEESAERLTARLVSGLVETGRMSRARAVENAVTFKARMLSAAHNLSRSQGRTITPEEVFQLASLTMVPADNRMSVIDDATILRQPKVRSAALKIDGRIFVGPNHAEAFLAAEDELGTDDFGVDDEGFITTDGRFLDRQQAAEEFASELGEGPTIQRFGAASEDFESLDDQIIADSEMGELVLAQPGRGAVGVAAPEEVRKAATEALERNALKLTEEELAHTSISIFAEPKVKQKRTVDEVGQEFQDRAQLDLTEYTPENVQQMGRLIAAEVLRELRDNIESAIEWYADRIRNMQSILGLIHPEIRDNDRDRNALNIALAITSQGTAVPTNLDMAEVAYEQFKRTGKFPIIGTGQQAPSQKSNFEMVNRMIDEFGFDEVARIFRGYSTQSQLNQLMDGSGADLAATIVPGSVLLGPKVGRFFQNLNGNFSELTVDLWFMRMWGRLSGKLMKTTSPELKAAHRETLRLVATPEVLEKIGLSGVDAASMSDEQLTVLAYDVHRVDGANNFERDGNTAAENALYRAAKTITTEDGTIDAPSNGTERVYHREAVQAALAQLAELGIIMNPAAVQATVWYPEKALYAHQGAGNARSEPTDFEAEARRLAQERGFSTEDIDSALQPDGEPGGRLASDEAEAGLGDRGGEDFHLTLVEQLVGLRPVPGRSGEVRAFGGRGQRNGVGARFAPTNEGLAALRQLGAATPTFVEVNAKKFVPAIAAAKKAHPFGASVELKDASEYEGMRLFLAETIDETPNPNNKSGVSKKTRYLSGFAIKPDGDIVSAFNHPEVGKQRRAEAMLLLAIQEGGWKLDAFDTVLPDIYSRMGFVTTGRILWDESQKPPGWDKKKFAKFNNGEPDVVFMRLDPLNAHPYVPGEGPLFQDYGEGAASNSVNVAVPQTTTLESAPTGGNLGARGNIALRMADNAAFMRLLEASDETTFQHELSHYFLHQMVTFAKLGLADQQMLDDLNTVVEWTGAADIDSLVLPFEDGRFQPGTTELERPHEIFARGWEAYLATARAPSPELKGLFRKFRAWAAIVYGGVKHARDRVGKPLDSRITDVYDRLLVAEIAVDEELGNFSEPLISNAADVGLDAGSAVYQRYLAAWQEVKEAALDKVSKSHISKIRKQKRKLAKQIRAEIRAEVEAEVASDPASLAISWIKRGEHPTEDVMNPGTGLSPTRIDDIYGSQSDRVIEILNGIGGRGRDLVNDRGPQGVDFYLVDDPAIDETPDGLDPDDVADIFGFASGKQLVDSMLANRTVEQRIQEQVNRRIATAPEFSEEAIIEEARNAVLGSDREAMLKAEMRLIRDFLAQDADAEARREQADTGPPAASDAASQVEAARQAASDPEATDEQRAEAQIGVVQAEAARRVGTEGRRAQRGAARRLAGIEESIDTGRLKHRAYALVGDGKAGGLKRERNGWLAVARREGRKARKAVAEGRWSDVAESIERQLVANYAAEEAARLLGEVEKGRQFLAKFRKGKEIAKLRAPGFDGASVVQGLLARYDVRRSKSEDVPPTLMERKIRRAVEKTQRAQQFESLLDFKKKADEAAMRFDFPSFLETRGSSEVVHWSELTVSEFLGLVDTVKNVAAITSGKVKDILTGKLVDSIEAGTKVADRIKQFNPGIRKDKNLNAAPISLDNLRKWVRHADAELLKIEALVDFLGGAGIDSPVRLFIWEPIEQGAILYRDLVHRYTDPMNDVIRSFDNRRMGKRFIIPELDPNISVTYSDIIMMGLNWGNTSNRYKLVAGYENHRRFGWNEQGFEAAIAKIEPDDWDRIQKIWDLMSEPVGEFKSLKDVLFAHEFEQTGRVPTAYEATPFTTPGGKEMRGGYFPVVYNPDPGISMRTYTLSQEQEIKGAFGYSQAGHEVDQGHMKSRAEGFARPILLDPLVIPRHLDKVLKDVAFREPIVNVWQILQQRQVREAIQDGMGIEYYEALQNWVKKIAGVRTSPIEHGAQKVTSMSRWLRQGTTMTGLGFRVFTGLLQLTGLFPVIAEVGPKHTLPSLLRMMSVANAPEMISNAMELSSELRNRATTKDRELAAAVESLKGTSSPALRASREHAFILITVFDRIVSAVAFDAQYNKSMEEHGDHERAVREGNRAIRNTQGAGDTKDLSAIMSNQNELARWMTIFGSFASNLYAQQRRMYRLAMGDKRAVSPDGTPLRKRNLRHAMALWAGYILAPALIEALLRGEAPDEDELEGDDLIRWAMTRVALFSAMPVKVIAEPLAGLFAPEQRVFLGRSPTSRLYRPVFSLGDNIRDAWTGEEEFDAKDATSDILNLIGVGLHLPVGQLDVWVNNFWGDLRYDRPQDLVSDLIVRRRDEE